MPIQKINKGKLKYINMYPIFDILPRLWESGHKTVYQDGKWHLFAKSGDGLVCGNTFRELCVNIVLSGL